MKQHGWKDKNILLPLSELSLASKECWAAVRSSGKSLLFADHCSIWFFTEARTYKIKKGKKGMNEQIPYSPCCDACMKDPHLHLILRSISGNVWKMCDWITQTTLWNIFIIPEINMQWSQCRCFSEILIFLLESSQRPSLWNHIRNKSHTKSRPKLWWTFMLVWTGLKQGQGFKWNHTFVCINTSVKQQI